MPLDALVVAAVGLAILLVVAIRPLLTQTSFRLLEPAAIIVGLLCLFLALHNASTQIEVVQADMAQDPVLTRLHFRQYCENNLNGVASFSNNMAYCERNHYIVYAHWLD